MATSTPAKPGFKYIQFDTSTFAARITLNFPPYNVLTVPMMVELSEAIESLNGRADVKCILMDSSQKACGYGISVEDSRPERIFQTLDAFNRVFHAIAEIGKPLMVIVNGPAIGAGSELVAFGDLVIATPNARFAQPEVKMGVFPPFAAIMLPQLIGPKKTYELILTGNPLTADDAQRFGFVNKVVTEAELKKTVNEMLARIGQFSGPVLEMTKRVISSSIGKPLTEAMKQTQYTYLNTFYALEDVQEGL